MSRGFGDVVVASPAIERAANFSEAVDDDPVKKLIAKPSIEQFDIAVLPRATR